MNHLSCAEIGHNSLNQHYVALDFWYTAVQSWDISSSLLMFWVACPQTAGFLHVALRQAQLPRALARTPVQDQRILEQSLRFSRYFPLQMQSLCTVHSALHTATSSGDWSLLHVKTRVNTDNIAEAEVSVFVSIPWPSH